MSALSDILANLPANEFDDVVQDAEPDLEIVCDDCHTKMGLKEAAEHTHDPAIVPRFMIGWAE